MALSRKAQEGRIIPPSRFLTKLKQLAFRFSLSFMVLLSIWNLKVERNLENKETIKLFQL